MKRERVFNQRTYPLRWNYQMIFNRYCRYSHLSNNYPDLSLNSWKDYTYDLPNYIVTIPHIRNSLRSFWSEVYLNDNTRQDMMFVQFKVKTGRYTSRSISYVQRVGYSDLESLVNAFLGFWSIRSELYKVERIYQIIYTYKMIPKIQLETRIVKEKGFEIEKLSHFKFYGYDLPSTMNYKLWGILVGSTPVIVYKPKSKLEYHIEVTSWKQVVSLYSGDHLVLTFTDILLDVNDLSTFQRRIKDQDYLFVKGELKLKTVVRESPYLSILSSTEKHLFNVITMDIETREEDDQLIPYCISLYDGVKCSSFYLSDYIDSTEMLVSAILSIMRRKYNGYKVYLHNFSRFDGVFLLKIFALVSDEIIPVIRDDKIIELRLKYGLDREGRPRYQLIFRDSYLLLSHSLKDLTKFFNVENKGLFPYRFVNNNYIFLDYRGPVPAFEYFDGISLKMYEIYSRKYSVWDLRREVIRYCEQDCRSLYKVLSVFHDQIYSHFQIDFLIYPSISSLSLSIYRTHFLSPDQRIPLIGGEMFKDMHSGYTGGAVDVYQPYGKEIYRYDVNSLYPSVMSYYPMPVGTPHYFEGDISLFDSSPFGVFEVEIKVPQGMNKPILQQRVSMEYGSRTVSPVGCWRGLYFSDEVFNAIEQGYSVTFLRGYLFEEGYLFKDYVSILFDLKMNAKRHDPMYTISKLLLNSLYGRFGMDPMKEMHSIVDFKDSFRICNEYDVTNVIYLSPEKELISYRRDTKEASIPNISIPISMAVTAYARISMTAYKSWSHSLVYYTDTDSIDTHCSLDLNKVGRGLGQMKLEQFFDQAVFLAPKVYGGVVDENEYVKIKGFKNSISYASLSDLLTNKNKLSLIQEKWYKNLTLGVLEVKQEIYTLVATENKRVMLFENQKEKMKTFPLYLSQSKITKINPLF